jgi:hypothetical protein
MDPSQLLGQTSVFTKLTLLVAAVPLVAAAVYAVRPSEARLALMRPFSLAALFAGVAGTLSGFVYVFAGLAASGPQTRWSAVYAGISEAIVPSIFGFTCLTLAWLLVAVGMWRGVREG